MHLWRLGITSMPQDQSSSPFLRNRTQYHKCVLLCEHVFTHNVCGLGKMHCFFNALARSLGFCQKARNTSLPSRPCLYSSSNGICLWIRLRMSSPSCVKRDVYLSASSASLKTGSSAALAMRAYLRYKTPVLQARYLLAVVDSPRLLVLPIAAAFLYKSTKHGAWYLASNATRSPALN